MDLANPLADARIGKKTGIGRPPQGRISHKIQKDLYVMRSKITQILRSQGLVFDGISPTHLCSKDLTLGCATDPFQSHFSSLERVDTGKFGNVSKLCFCACSDASSPDFEITSLCSGLE